MATAKELMEAARKKIEENRTEAAKIGAVYKFVLTGDDGGTFILNLKDNPGVTEGEGDAECTIKMKAKHYVKMVEGRASGQSLFVAGKLKVKGDMKLAMRLEKLTDTLK